jgi:DivIVA domain-containing protein
MDLSSMDVERKTFDGTRKGGFDRDQVNEFLGRVAKVLSKLESELSVSRRHASELQRQLDRARREAEEGSKSFLFAAELKQRLLTEAEERATEILQAAHGASGTADPADAVRNDLDLVRRRLGVEDGGAGPEVSSPASGELAAAELEAARAEAAEILATAQGQADRIVANAATRRDALHGEVEQALGEARQLLLGATEKDADARAEAQRLLYTAARKENEARKLLESAGKKESEARAEANRLIAATQSKAEKIRHDAEGRVGEANQTARKLVEEAGEEARRVVDEARREGEVILAKAAAVRTEVDESKAEVERQQESASGDREAARSARERAEEESEAAQRAKEEAEGVLVAAQAAESEAASAVVVEKEKADRLREEAAAKAEALQKSAKREAARLEASAKQERRRTIEAAHAAAAEILDDARTEADKVLETSRIRHRLAQSKLRDLDAMLEKAQRQIPQTSPADRASGEDQVVVLLDEARDAAEEVKTEVWLKHDVSDESSGAKEPRGTRYTRRSAGLPHLGEEATHVLGKLDSLRTSDSEKKSRRRKSK